MDTGELANSRFVIVEDEWMLAQQLTEDLQELKCEVVGCAAQLDEAGALLDKNDYDAAIIDLDLQGESAEPLVERLWERGRAVLVVSGFANERGERLADVPFLDRPYTFGQLKEAIKQTMRFAGERRTRV